MGKKWKEKLSMNLGLLIFKKRFIETVKWNEKTVYSYWTLFKHYLISNVLIEDLKLYMIQRNFKINSEN